MRNLVRILGTCKKAILLVAVLLIVQAFSELALPTLTADVVDVGIEQRGISGPVMEQMREQTYQDLSMFMTDKERSILSHAYDKQKDMYYLKKLDGKEKDQLDDAVLEPVVILGFLTPEISLDSARNYTAVAGPFQGKSLSEIAEAYQSGDLTGSQLVTMRREVIKNLGNVNESILNQIAVKTVQHEYEAAGLDVNELQHRYLMSTGGRMLVMAVIMTAVSILVGFFASRTSSQIARNLREKIFSRIMMFSSREIDQFQTSSLITRCTNDVQQIQFVVVMLLRMVLYAPIMAAGGIFMVATSHTGLWWIIVIAVALLGSLIMIVMHVVNPKFKIMQTLVDKLNGVSREILTGLQVIRAFTREGYEESRFDKANTDVMKTQLFTTRVLIALFPAMSLIMNGVTLAIVWFGSHKVAAGRMQVGDMMAFINYAMMIIMAFLMLTGISMMLPRAIVAADRITEVLETAPSIVDRDDTSEADEKLAHGRGDITFEHVNFRYPNAADDVLHDLTFTAHAGETTAVIGSTGCGKSTLLNLIPRLYDVTGGSISIDDVDIREVSQHALRQEIGYIPQKALLFSGTIESNIKYSDENMSDEQMVRAAEIAQACEFIDQRSKGYESAISQGGTNVSGGQRQRLAIARAIAKKARIVLFDDSFSALDYRTDHAVRDAIAKDLADSCVIIVAQRISTIMHAEQILVLDDGRIVGRGTHKELLRNCAEYQEIAKSQLSEKEILETLGENEIAGAAKKRTLAGGEA